ncbi:MAG: tetratricopeptide repeat protein [Proteobacteria bacterium]|nr:tetratricopeptide repeat protein [Pseudomonadota bacterium]
MSQNTTISAGATHAAELLRIATAALDAGDLADAETQLRQVAAIAPNDPVAAHQLAVVLVKTNRSEEAAAVLKKQASVGALPVSLLLLGTLFEATGRVQDAELCFEKVLKREPENQAAAARLAAIREERRAANNISSSGTADDITALEQAVERAPQNAAALHNLGCALVRAKRFADAESMLRQSVQISNHPQTWMALGELYETTGHIPQAYGCYKNTFNVAPNDYHLLMKLGALTEVMEDKPGAREHYRRALEVKPGDYQATSKYTSLIFDKEPELAVRSWEDVLTKAGDNVERQSAALDQLVCHKEWWERIKRGEMPYHCARLSDLFFTYALDDVKQWDAINQKRLADKPGNPSLLAAAALSKFSLRDRHGAETLFRAAAEKAPDHVLSTIRFEPAFYEQLRAFTDADLTRTLPPVIVAASLVPDPKGILYLSCNFTYFRAFALPMVVSMRETSPHTPVHIHIMDANEEETAFALAFLQKLSPIKFALSVERPGLTKGPIQEARSYYHAVRFIRFYEHLRHYGVPLWLMDVDAVINTDLDGLFATLDGNDVAMRIRPGRKEPWNQFNACVVGAGTSGPSFEYIRLVAAYLAYFFQNNGLRWGIDQLAMYGVFADMEDRKEEPRLALLGEREVDYTYRDDGYVWCNSGAGKFQHLKRIAKPNSLPLANFDGNKFVGVFERHWKECERIAAELPALST